MKKARILVVEDEPIVAMDIKGTLEKMEYQVVGIASTGMQAIELVKEEKPGLVLMDIMLKEDMTGIEAAQHIWTQYHIPIIYLTAVSDSEIIENAKFSEPFGYLIKPYNDREIMASIEVALYKHQVEEERALLRKELEEKEKQINKLMDLIPICMYCKKIEQDDGYWNRFESYFNEYAGIQFSHGICPECVKEHYVKK